MSCEIEGTGNRLSEAAKLSDSRSEVVAGCYSAGNECDSICEEIGDRNRRVKDARAGDSG